EGEEPDPSVRDEGGGREVVAGMRPAGAALDAALRSEKQTQRDKGKGKVVVEKNLEDWLGEEEEESGTGEGETESEEEEEEGESSEYEEISESEDEEDAGKKVAGS
ncbi:MAG: hypothetical protein Q9211_002040, partial [Gyalolechia sp. 1 TL-2023]